MSEEGIRWVIGLLVAGGIAFLIKRYVAQRVNKLEWRLFVTPIQLPDSDLRVMHVNSRATVSNPHVVEVKVKNKGPGSVKAADWSGATCLLRGSLVVSELGRWLDGEWQGYDTGVIAKTTYLFPAYNLNKGQQISVRLLTSGKPELTWQANLLDAKLEPGPPPAEKPEPIGGLSAGVAALIGVYGVYALPGVEWWHWIAGGICLLAAVDCLWYWLNS